MGSNERRKERRGYFTAKPLILSTTEHTLQIPGARKISLGSVGYFRVVSKYEVFRDEGEVISKKLFFGIESVSGGPRTIVGYLRNRNPCEDAVDILNSFLFRAQSLTVRWVSIFSDEDPHSSASTMLSTNSELVPELRSDSTFQYDYSLVDGTLFCRRGHRFPRVSFTFFLLFTLQWYFFFFSSVSWSAPTAALPLSQIIVRQSIAGGGMFLWPFITATILLAWKKGETWTFGDDKATFRSKFRILPGNTWTVRPDAVINVGILRKETSPLSALELREKSGHDEVGGNRVRLRLFLGGAQDDSKLSIDKLTEDDALHLAFRLRQKYRFWFRTRSNSNAICTT